MSNTHSVFVYGTLLFPEVTAGLGIVSAEDGSDESVAVLSSDAVLHGYERFKVQLRKEANFPAIVSANDKSVSGRLLQQVTDESLHRMDAFEGITDSYYSRELVTVAIEEGEVEAWTYVCGDRLRSYLDGTWDAEQFRQSELEWYLANVVTGR